MGVDAPGDWREVLNTDAKIYGGSGTGNATPLKAEKIPADGKPYSVLATLPPLGTIALKR